MTIINPETVADVAFIVGQMQANNRLRPVDGREWIEAAVDIADDFETKYGNIDWNKRLDSYADTIVAVTWGEMIRRGFIAPTQYRKDGEP